MSDIPSAWKNRIVSTGEVDPESLLAHALNWSIHPQKQQEALEQVLGDIGWVGAIMISQNSGQIIDGHARVRVALRNHQPTVPVFYVDLTEDEERKILAIYDMITRLRVTDEEKLAALLDGIELPPALDALVKEFAGLEKLDLDLSKDEIPEDPGAQIDKADELREKWQTEVGQLWQLGERHRVICGDCTDPAVVERLMGGEKYNLLTDPPYNIGFEYNEYQDSMTDEEYADFCKTWFTTVASNAICSIFTPGPKNEHLYPLPKDKGYWLKRYASAGASAFNLRTIEPILIYGKIGQKRNFDLFDYSSGFPDELRAARWAALVEDKHPPAKPLALWMDIIGLFSGDMILDCFLGNGTTTIACEKLGRVSCGIEKDSSYVGVVLERWSQMTGETPVLVGLTP